MISLRSIVLSAIVTSLCWYWLKAREIKDYALSKARNYCSRLNLVLLDETVVLDKLALRRQAGSPRLYRRYNFDFTASGTDRYIGSVEILGKQVLAIKLAPHVLPEED